MQDGINVQAGKFLKTNKRAGWNFQKIITMKNKFSGNFSIIDKRAEWNKTVQVGIFQKIYKLCSTFIG